MSIFNFLIYPHVSAEEAWEEVEASKIEVLYSEEEPEGHRRFLVCRLPSMPAENVLSRLTTIQNVEAAPDLTTDWNAQWAIYGANFHDGYVHVQYEGKEFLLKPGPGFGDASHPSTRLVLKLMKSAAKQKGVLDIGCGSGILSIAAAHLEAAPIYAIDIDPEAARHTLENAELNRVEGKIWVGNAEELSQQGFSHSLVGLMNMISSEQEAAWHSIEALHPLLKELIVSGILKEEQDDYLRRWNNRGWKTANIQEEAGWLGIHFIQ